MKVKDLIEKLQQFDPELPVCVADWNEGYSFPSEPDAEQVSERTGKYYPKELPEGSTVVYVTDRVVVIGKEG